MQRMVLACCLAFGFAACDVGGDDDSGGRPDGGRDGAATDGSIDGGTGDDAGPGPGDSSIDSGPAPLDASPVDPCNPACGPTELCGETNDGDGVDNDCNGRVDETCICPATGVTHACFAGAPDRRSRGACTDGIETCDEFRQWGPCVGGIFPTDEVCDGVDNDCNGMPDDGVGGCMSSVVCPTAQGAAPLSNFPLRGGIVYPGDDARTWHWTIECPDTVPEGRCPMAVDPDRRDTSVYFVQSGAYRVGVQIEIADGTTLGCTWTVYVAGSGLRVELNWDTQGDLHGDTDVDLHLHRWTHNGVDSDFFDADDCYYANCKASSNGFLGGERDLDWRDSPAMGDHSDTTDLSVCADAPHGEGNDWQTKGACYNPRLDVDVITCTNATTDPTAYDFCAPENINVDQPVPGIPYRVMVNYFSSHSYSGVTIPSVNIYCSGQLRGSFGLDPLVQLRESGGESGENWMVADVVFINGVCGADCMVYPIGSIVRGAGFGPAWACDATPGSGVCTPRP